MVDALNAVVIGIAAGASAGWITHAGGIGSAVGFAAWLLAALFLPMACMFRGGQRRGQTFGKQALAIRVVDLRGMPVEGGTIVLREVVGKWLPGLITSGFYTLADDLWPLWDPRNQALHDKIASTLVVRAPNDEPSGLGGGLGDGHGIAGLN